MSDVWKSALQVLDTKVNQDLMNTWFRTMRCLEVTDSTCVLEIDTDFRLDWVNANYLDIITSAVQEVTVPHMTVEVRSVETRLREERPAAKNESFTFDVSDSVAGFVTSTSRSTGPLMPPVMFHETGVGGQTTFDDYYAEAMAGLSPVVPHQEEAADVDYEELARTVGLNPRYTFDEFVVGPSNQLIVSAAEAVATKSKRYNPLFIFGNVGLGKTHLLHAIGNYALRRDHRTRIVYTSAEAFMNDMITSINNRDMHFFRAQYREQCDLLLIDDIQFLVGKASTQGEFFHTFNALHGAGKQVVLTCDTPPRDLDGLDDRLISRFAWGLVVDIQIPNYETRLAILRRKAEKDHIHLPDDVANFLAENIQQNVRELEGALVRLEAQAALSRKRITLEDARKLFSKIRITAARSISVPRIIDVVAAHFGLTAKDLKSKARPKRISVPRQIAMFLARKHTDLSFPEIGRLFGGKDHTTVMTAYKKFDALMTAGEDPLVNEVLNLEQQLGR